MNKHAKVALAGVAIVAGGVVLVVLAGRLIPAEWQPWANFLLAAVIGILVILANIAQFSGYTLRDIVGGRRDKAGKAEPESQVRVGRDIIQFGDILASKGVAIGANAKAVIVEGNLLVLDVHTGHITTVKASEQVRAHLEAIIEGDIKEPTGILDLPRSLSKDSEALRRDHDRQVAHTLCEFGQYLDQVSLAPAILQLPDVVGKAFGIQLQTFPADGLYSFQEYDSGDFGLGQGRSVPYRTILWDAPTSPTLVIGESGIGKTSLLQRMVCDQAQSCLEHNSDVIPVLIRLGQYGRGRDVWDLIAHSLISRGANLSADQLPYLLREGRLTLFFDAFDEVLERHVPEVQRELQSLIDDYPGSRVIVTTRQFRIPRLASIKRYQLQPLSYERVQSFVQMYLGPDYQAFLEEISRKGLAAIASNTLLLTLLILLYLRQGELPRSRGQILQRVVDCVRDWDRDKPERFGLPLSRVCWDTRVEILAKLAFSSLSSGKSYALDKRSVEITLTDTLDDLEERRQIPSGLTLEEILDSLAATGFVVQVDEGVIFWHRAFAEHFAAREMASRLESEPGLLDELIKHPDWEYVVPLAASRARDPSCLIEKILVQNIFTAGRALLECDMTEGNVHRRTVDALSHKCGSATRPIRQIAIGLLQQLSGSYVDGQFQRLLDSEFVHVEKAALVEVARRKMPNAREMVVSRLDWDTEPSIWLEGPSRTAVIEALGEFDDAESHLQIIRMWRERPDDFTNQSCRNAFLKIARRRSLSDRVKSALLDFFLRDSDDVLESIKLWGISEVLAALGDSSVAPHLVSALKEPQPQPDDAVTRGINTAKVLASFDEPKVVQQLIECATDQSVSDYARRWTAEALSESNGRVSLDVFRLLARDANDDVRSAGVRGLGRFPFSDVRDIVLHAVHPPPFERTEACGFGFAHVQAAAFEVLALHGQIEALLEEENQPEYFYDNSLDVLFNTVSAQHLVSMLPLLDAIAEGAFATRIVIKAAWVLADLGYVDRAQAIVEDLRRHRLSQGWTAHDIVKGIHRLAASYALDVVDEVLAKAGELKGGSSSYLRGLCIEALQRIGTSDACERLAEIAGASLEDGVGLDAERALRGIEFLAPRERERWLLALIREHPGMERIALRRALEALGVIGSHESLALLHDYLNGGYSVEIQATCFWAIHNIHKRAGQLWFNNQERV